ncbi:MAG: hypothetical protein A2808_02970 [Candidatus Moranbacteria bacterium RIFCSPHIGHO2_01_FULL_55_24]|nr:MAG: hypothetical protein A2808_02970 [Candidatus Moranbacteria bacterium RIFCSPHIGHO2_01_FULL_55_24]
MSYGYQLGLSFSCMLISLVMVLALLHLYVSGHWDYWSKTKRFGYVGMMSTLFSVAIGLFVPLIHYY